MIEFVGVTKTFKNGDTIFRDLSFKIEPQQFVVIEGPSGSGKTTLLRLIYKELEPTEGKIIIDGQDITRIKKSHVTKLRHKIGFAFQDFKLMPDRTVWENIALALEILKFKPALIKERLDHLLELVGLTSKAHLFPRQLSGGEVQRVCIARAIAAEPAILLADEPTGNLDAETSRSIADLLSQINGLGTTVVLASHDTLAHQHLNLTHFTIDKGKIVTKQADKPAAEPEKPKEEPDKPKQESDKPLPKTKHHEKH